jgi:predicted transcriptional regulator of viral defense system
MPQKPRADGPEIPLYGGKSARRGGNRGADRTIADLADSQHGVVTLAQLVSHGLGVGTIDKRVESGRLHRIQQGVYAVGRRSLTREGQFMAAVLACGEGAALSHRSAAELWGLRGDPRMSIDVTAPGRRGRTPRGIDAHRHGSLWMQDRAVVRGVPCTTVARTLLDLAGVVPVSELRRTVEEAEVKRLLDHRAVRRLLKRSRGRRGVARLRILIDMLDPDTKKTRSRLERRFLWMCEHALLPRPEVNVILDLGSVHLEADFLWRDARLIVETDGRESHGTAAAFENDRRRDQRLMLAGWQVLRCTWHQVSSEPAELARTIRTLLSRTPVDGPEMPLYGGKSARRRR